MASLVRRGDRMPPRTSRRGVFIVRPWRGKLIAQSWPRPRGKPHPNQLPGIEAWRRAIYMVKNAPPEEIKAAMELAAGTPFTWRDILTMSYYGTLWLWQTEDGAVIAPRHIYMSTINDLLNAIGATQGDLLFRGATQWQALAPGTAGQILATQGPSGDPQWIDPPQTGGAPIYRGDPFGLDTRTMNANDVKYCGVSLRQGTVVRGIAFYPYLVSPGQTFRCALYDSLNAQPNNLIAQTPAISSTPQHQVREAQFASPITIPTDGLYWAALWSSAGATIAAGCPEGVRTATGQPSTFPATAPTTSSAITGIRVAVSLA